MYEHLLEKYAKASQSHNPGAQPAALMEWLFLFLGRWVGPQKSKWCGKSATSWRTIDDPEWGNRPNALPFIFDDFWFLSASGQEIFITKEHWSDPHLALPKELTYVELRVRKQKNDDNYQKLLYARLPTDSLLCPVCCAFCIFCHGKRLGIASTHPAAVFATRAKLEPFHLITGDDVCKMLRKTARVVFALRSDDPSLRLWSSIPFVSRHAIFYTARSSRIPISRIASVGSRTHSLCTCKIPYLDMKTYPVRFLLFI